jgi:predicted RNA-binding Zn-ribbon protein involved in translation (DUF1610 family)
LKVRVKGRTVEVRDGLRACPHCGGEFLSPKKIDRFGNVIFLCELCGRTAPDHECQRAYESFNTCLLKEVL